MKNIHVRISGRTFALAFTLDALAKLEDTIDSFDFSEISSYTRSPRWLPDIVFILAQQGELVEGRALDVDRAWFGCHMSPSPAAAAKIQAAVLNAFTAGLTMETETDEDDGEVDVALEEIKKNGSASAGDS